MPGALSSDDLPPFPAPLSPLVGRVNERASLKTLLERDSIRLLTLIGPGGVGKTRLALQVAADVADGFVDGVAFVSLAAVTDARLVPTTIAQAFGLREGGGQDMTERLQALLRDRVRLLVLDNFEQIIDAAPFVTNLLSACPAVKALVTSRMSLRVSGEHEFQVLPLSLPDVARRSLAEEVTQFDAIDLFVQRARSVKPDFVVTPENASTVVEICHRLDGLPLAIELAAARTRVLSPPALLVRLGRRLPLLTGGARDAPLRLRTMRGAIAWSYDLLDGQDQAMFRRLAIFAGGFSLDAAGVVTSAQFPLPGAQTEDGDGGSQRATVAGQPASVADWALGPGHSALDLLASLVDKSLVRQVAPVAGEPRYRMLETIREHGLEQLEASGEEAMTRDAHAAYFLALAEEAETHLARAVEPAWLDRLDAEHDNLRGALAWLAQGAVADRLLRLGGALWLYWYYHGHLTEGRRWIEMGLTLPEAAAEPARAKALLGVGTLSHFQGDETRAGAWLEESLMLSRRQNDSWTAAFALTVLGNVAEDNGDYERASALFEEARQLFAERADPVNIAVTIYHLGIVAYGQGDLARARSLLEAALEQSRRVADPWSTAISLSYLAIVACDQSDLAAAAAALDEGLDLHLQIGSNERLAAWLRRAAVLAMASGNPVPCARLMGTAAAMEATLGVTLALPERETYERAIVAARNALGEQAYAGAVNAGGALAIEQAVAEGTATVAAAPDFVPPLGRRDAVAMGGLSTREFEVLRLVTQGLTDRQIGEHLSISTRTVSTHVGNIFGKLGIHARTEAAAYAVRHGLA
ncbi:MAG: ATP-binding protein [Thermomicrobiales bacterium]